MSLLDKYLINENIEVQNILLGLKGALKELSEYYQGHTHVVQNKSAAKNGINLIKLMKKDLDFIVKKFKGK